MDDSEIPDDIMQAARECCYDETFRLMANFGGAFHDEGTVKAIARALMAERERAKRLADDYAKRAWSATPSAQEAAIAAERISEAISNSEDTL